MIPEENKAPLTYLDLGYTSTLDRPFPKKKEKESYSTLDFDGLFEGFTLDKATGGELKLGGSSNDNGFLVSYDDQGNEVVRIDKDGLTIRGTTIHTVAVTGVKTDYNLH